MLPFLVDLSYVTSTKCCFALMTHVLSEFIRTWCIMVAIVTGLILKGELYCSWGDQKTTWYAHVDLGVNIGVAQSDLFKIP